MSRQAERVLLAERPLDLCRSGASKSSYVMDSESRPRRFGSTTR